MNLLSIKGAPMLFLFILGIHIFVARPHQTATPRTEAETDSISSIRSTYPKWTRIHLHASANIFTFHLREHGSFVEDFTHRSSIISDSISLYLRQSIHDFYISKSIPIVAHKRPKSIVKIMDYPFLSVVYPYKGDIWEEHTEVMETMDSVIVHTPEFSHFYRVLYGQCDKCQQKKH